MKVTSLFYAPFRLCKSLTTACFLIFACHATLMPAQSLNWRQIPGSAIDVGVGANGAVWVIGTGEPTPDQGIYRWTGSGFNKVAGGGVRIAVDPMGNPWVINSAGEIYRSENSGTKFIALPGKASDIGIGANGTVWIVGTNTVPGGYGVYRWNGSAFVAMPGGGVRISVDPDGYAWVVNSVGRIYRFVGSGFVTMPGEAVDIGIGGDGSVFISGTNGNVYKWNGVSDWVKLDGGGLIAVAADGTGNPWAVNSGRSIYAGTNVNVAPLGIQARKEIFEANRRDPANIGRFGIMQNTHPTNYVWYTIYT